MKKLAVLLLLLTSGSTAATPASTTPPSSQVVATATPAPPHDWYRTVGHLVTALTLAVGQRMVVGQGYDCIINEKALGELNIASIIGGLVLTYTAITADSWLSRHWAPDTPEARRLPAPTWIYYGVRFVLSLAVSAVSFLIPIAGKCRLYQCQTAPYNNQLNSLKTNSMSYFFSKNLEAGYYPLQAMLFLMLFAASWLLFDLDRSIAQRFPDYFLQAPVLATQEAPQASPAVATATITPTATEKTPLPAGREA